MNSRPILLAAILACALAPATAGAELFDFDSAPIHTALPIDLTVGRVTAHFSATGQGFSVQAADVMGFTPVGFGGLCIYPSSVFASDLLIGFSTTITDFSILFAPEEYGCDDSALMRVTAYQDGALAGTATASAPAPGTWPTGTLAFSSPAGFNHVIVHYERRPACGDWGPIFMVDDMNVTPVPTASASGGAGGAAGVSIAPNPFRSATTIRVGMKRSGPLFVAVHDAAGRRVRVLASGETVGAGERAIEWNGCDDSGRPVGSGIYFCRVGTGADVRITRMVVRH